ncbi:MAG: plasmid pRiA4b ORF-3 family protein [Candidatus Nanopelagicales bacterium]|nr:plasmid pRiA4b ORF-3 family protein [Candidatus Nanopelagicales bacterium]
MERVLAPAVFDVLANPRLPAPARATADLIDTASPVEVDQPTAARVMGPLLWITGRVGIDGLPLTKAGLLRPVDVSALMSELGWDRWWIGKGNRENQTPPAGMLRRAAISTKLIRKHKGMLQLTPAGRKVLADPVAMWFHVAEQLPVERDDGSRIAAVLAMLHRLGNATITQGGSAAARFRPADALAAMGWVHSDGTPIGEHEFDWAWDKSRDILAATGMSAYGPGDMTDPHDRVIFLRAALTRPVPDNTASLGPARPRPRPRRCHTITVRLNDITPTVWRQIRVDSTISLLGLHHAIQAAMGWTCSHLFAIEIGDYRYGYPDPDFDLTIDASTLKLDVAMPNVGDRARYEYDFGDGWEHTLTVDAIEVATDSPAVLGGANACPPEDCGGWPGYEDLLTAQSDPTHERHDELRQWLGYTFDPTEFNKAAADAAIKNEKLTRR